MLPRLILLLGAISTSSTAVSLPSRDTATIARRDLATVLADLSPINEDLRTLFPEVIDYNGTSAQKSTILSGFKQLNGYLQTATKDTKASVANATQAEQIINYLNYPIEQRLNRVVYAMETNKHGFEKATFKQVLIDAKNNFTVFNVAFLAKVPASPTYLRPSATNIVNLINSDMVRATNVPK